MFKRYKILIFLIVLILQMSIADTFAKSSFNIFPTPQELVYKNSEIILDNTWTIAVNTSSHENVKCAEYLRQRFLDNYSFNLGIENSKAAFSKRNILLGTTNDDFFKNMLISKGIVVPKEIEGEGYVLDVVSDSIVIVAKSPRGLFYGIQSLLQAIDFRKNSLVIPAIRIVDYPTIKIRGAHILDIDYENIKKQIDLMASLKFNTLIMFDWGYFKLDTGDYAEKLKDIFDYARERFIEPVPDLECFGSAGPLLTKVPEAAEGIWIQEERFRFENNEATPENPTGQRLINVITDQDSKLIVKSQDKVNIYREGQDYRVINGVITYPYLPTNQPTKIIRIPEGDIKKGETVLVTYNYVENKCASWAPWSIPYCPSSEKTYKFMFQTIQKVIELLEPRYISLGQSEIRGMNRDYRCKKRNLSNAELFADHINKIYDFIKEIDPEIEIISWDDMINPWHNGGVEDYQVNFGGPPGRTDAAVDLIPKDIIVAIWWYDKSDWLNKIKNSPQFFANKGFKYFVSPWKNKDNILEWSKIAKEKDGCIGLIVTNWDGVKNNLEGIKYSAEVSWH